MPDTNGAFPKVLKAQLLKNPANKEDAVRSYINARYSVAHFLRTKAGPDTDKADALILDYAGNADRLGPVDNIAPPPQPKRGKKGNPPVKLCENCFTVVHPSVRICPGCGEAFPTKEEVKIKKGEKK